MRVEEEQLGDVAHSTPVGQLQPVCHHLPGHVSDADDELTPGQDGRSPPHTADRTWGEDLDRDTLPLLSLGPLHCPGLSPPRHLPGHVREAPDRGAQHPPCIRLSPPRHSPMSSTSSYTNRCPRELYQPSTTKIPTSTTPYF